MIATKLADKPEQFQDERGAWHVGRRVHREAVKAVIRCVMVKAKKEPTE